MPIKPIARWLADLQEGGSTRYAALEALWGLGPDDHRCVPALVSALVQGKDDVPQLAARSLGLIGPAAGEAVSALRNSLEENLGRLRGWSADALGRIGPAAISAVPRLRELVSDDDPWVRVLALGALAKLDFSPAWVTALASTKELSDVALQSWGLALLIDVVDKDEQVVSALLSYLWHWSDEFVETVAEALATRPGARQELLQALVSENSGARRNAARVLGNQLPPADELVLPLTRALSDTCPWVRWSAAGALLQLSRAGVEVGGCHLHAIRHVAETDTSEDARVVCKQLLAELSEGPPLGS